MDNIVNILRNVTDGSLRELTLLYTEQSDCLEQMVDTTCRQFKAGTGHVLFTPQTKKKSTRTISTTLSNKENDLPSINTTTNNSKIIFSETPLKKKNNAQEEENEEEHKTPVVPRTGRRRRRRTTSTQLSESDVSSIPTITVTNVPTAESAPIVQEESREESCEEPQVTIKPTIDSTSDELEEKETPDVVNTFEQPINDEKPANEETTAKADEENQPITKVISRKGRARRNRRAKNAADDNTTEITTEIKESTSVEPTGEQSVVSGHNSTAPTVEEEVDVQSNEPEMTPTTSDAMEIDDQSEAIEKQSEKTVSEPMVIESYTLSPKPTEETSTRESRTNKSEAIIIDVEQTDAPMDDEMEVVEVVLDEDTGVIDNLPENTVHTPTKEERTITNGVHFGENQIVDFEQDRRSGVELDPFPERSSSEDAYYMEDEFNDTIMLSVPQQFEPMDTYESPVKFMERQQLELQMQNQTLNQSTVEIQVTNHSSGNVSQVLQLSDLEKKIQALKGQGMTPEKLTVPAPASFLSPDVMKIMERNSTGYSSPPPTTRKFFEVEPAQPDSPETPESKTVQKSPPRLHIVPTKFVSLSPRPPTDEELKQIRANKDVYLHSTAQKPKNNWNTDTANLSPIHISFQPKRTSSAKSMGNNNTLANLLIENEDDNRDSTQSGTKRKLDEDISTQSNEPKKMRMSDEALSKLSISSTSSFTSVSTMNPSVGGKMSCASDVSSQSEPKTWIQNIIGGMGSFLTGGKAKKPEEKKKKHGPIKSLQQAELAKRKEEQRRLEKERAADAKKKKLRENLEAQKKKRDELKKDDKPKAAPSGPSKIIKPTSTSTQVKPGTKPVATKPGFKKPDLTDIKVNTNSQPAPEVPRTSMDTYRLSLESDCGEDEEQEMRRRVGKRIPNWASGSGLKEQILRSTQLDPDLIFAPVTTCDLNEIFGPSLANTEVATRKRTSSRDWRNDHFTVEEELTYKQSMGFI